MTIQYTIQQEAMLSSNSYILEHVQTTISFNLLYQGNFCFARLWFHSIYNFFSI